MSPVTPAPNGVFITIRVVPRASRNELGGVVGDALKIRLQAPPVDGKANKALLKFLARALEIPVRNVEIVSGETSRQKRVLVRGRAMAEVAQALHLR